jgi:hypothetical protein
MDRCTVETPALREVWEGHRAACHLLDHGIFEKPTQQEKIP